MLPQMFQITTLETKKHDETNLFGKFLLKPLPYGHGITIGNTLRRILLNDIYGTAITGVSIIGINSEFETIPGLREDVLEILLNLKQTILMSSTSQTCFAHLKIVGPRIITAKCINFPTGVEVLNPNLYIATLYSDRCIEMILKIEHGQGYKFYDQSLVNSKSPFLTVDGLFMPVRKVTYFINELYTSSGNGFHSDETLELDIWTNGAISPELALKSSIKYAITLFNTLLSYPQPQNTKVNRFDMLIVSSTKVPIEELYLSVRVYKCLKNAGINSIADLLKCSMVDLYALKNFGQKCSRDVEDKLRLYFKSKFEVS